MQIASRASGQRSPYCLLEGSMGFLVGGSGAAIDQHRVPPNWYPHRAILPAARQPAMKREVTFSLLRSKGLSCSSRLPRLTSIQDSFCTVTVGAPKAHAAIIDFIPLSIRGHLRRGLDRGRSGVGVGGRNAAPEKGER
jgi:hypothetical protein